MSFKKKLILLAPLALLVGLQNISFAVDNYTLGKKYYFKRQYIKALEYFSSWLEQQLRTARPKSHAVGSTYVWIGNIYYRSGKAEKAIEYYLLAAAIYKQRGYVSTNQESLGHAYVQLLKYDKAIAHYKNALQEDSKDQALSQLIISRHYENLGDVYYIAGRYAEALDYYRRTLAIYANTFGSEHATLARFNHTISVILHKMNNRGQALFYAKRAMNISIKAVGQDDPTAKYFIKYNKKFKTSYQSHVK